MAYSASLPHDEDLSMQAREFMTKDPITVSADTPTPEIARLLLAHGISAAPVAACRASSRRLIFRPSPEFGDSSLPDCSDNYLTKLDKVFRRGGRGSRRFSVASQLWSCVVLD